METEYDNALRRCSSADRGAILLDALENEQENPSVFWFLAQDWWSSCDDMHDLADDCFLLFSDVKQIPVEFMTPANREFYDSLPDEFVAYRGSSCEKMAGLSWTLDRDVALRFARGHRWIRVSDPCIVDVTITKDSPDFFFVSNDRNEKEVVLNPYIDSGFKRLNPADLF